MQRRGPTADTTAARVKSLFLFAQHEFGSAQADAFLKSVRLDRDYLEDETRSLPTEVWHLALTSFVARWGKGALLATVPYVVHAENLGVWTRVLRGTLEPGRAFEQLNQYGGEHVTTESWQTLSKEPGLWRGRTVISGSNADEADGLCSLARATELSAIPLLFGLPPASAKLVSTTTQQDGSIAEEFEVNFYAEKSWPHRLGGAVSLSASMALLLWLGTQYWVLAALPTVVGVSGLALFRALERRRVQIRTQLNRIAALERAATLRDTRERGSHGFRQGSVLAGRYRLGQKLGVGASGTVWEAQRLSDGATVAIKLLRAAVAHDTVAADRLRREAQALGLAWHTNVVEVFDDGVLPDGTSYLVMERLSGETLASRLRRRRFLSTAELLPIALQVCDAIEAVHAAGIIHRDLKPSNIFLSGDTPSAANLSLERGGGSSSSNLPIFERVKLLDFGVARVEWAETRLTNMEGPIGTPGYMSPEQEQGQEVDSRTDIYSLGGVLYECLTGAPPTQSGLGSSQTELVASSGVMPSREPVPETWQPIIDKAMATHAEDRFPDARALKLALLSLARPSDIGSAV